MRKRLRLVGVHAWFPCAVVLALLLSVHGCGDDGGPPPDPAALTLHWSGFRGNDGVGTSSATTVPTVWDATTGSGVKWTAPLSLDGLSSPVVLGDRVFVTAADANTRLIYSFYTADGTPVAGWPKSVSPGKTDPHDAHYPYMYATSTIVTDGSRIYALFPSGDLACYDYEGYHRWTKDLAGLAYMDPADNGVPYGHVSSLVYNNGVLFVQLDLGTDTDSKSFVVLFDRDGNVIRSVGGGTRATGYSYSSPIFISPGGVDQFVTFACPWVFAHSPDGTELWKAQAEDSFGSPWTAESFASPFIANGLVIVASEQGTMAYSPLGSGTITETWSSTATAGYANASPVADGNLVFVPDGTLLRCLDASNNGTELWADDITTWVSGMDYYSFWASPIVVDGYIYLVSVGKEGYVPAKVLVGAVDAAGITRLSVNPMEAADPATESYMATPAYADGHIYIRSTSTLYCIEP